MLTCKSKQGKERLGLRTEEALFFLSIASFIHTKGYHTHPRISFLYFDCSFQVPKSRHDSVTPCKSFIILQTTSSSWMPCTLAHSTKNTYCQGLTRLGLVLMLVRFIPCVLKVTSASARAPGEVWLIMKETRVFHFVWRLESFWGFGPFSLPASSLGNRPSVP